MFQKILSFSVHERFWKRAFPDFVTQNYLFFLQSKLSSLHGLLSYKVQVNHTILSAMYLNRIYHLACAYLKFFVWQQSTEIMQSKKERRKVPSFMYPTHIFTTKYTMLTYRSLCFRKDLLSQAQVSQSVAGI